MKFLIILLSAYLSIASAAEVQRNIGITPASNAKRIALVIGNSAYKDAPLKNPINDAKDMATTLRRLGFDVIEKTNVNQKEMNLAIAQFGDRLRGDTVALFFYAGHGMQVKGKNYLIPTDALITSEATVRAMAVDVDTVMDQLAVSPMNIVILDACRNNPFERKFRSNSGGLAQMDAPKGSLIAYATAPGKTAADGENRNGLYTQELLKHIQTPGLPLEAVFKRVRNGVIQASGEMQTPWEVSSLTGDFYFRHLADTGVPVNMTNTPSTDTAGQNIMANTTPLAIELAFWQAAKESAAPAQLRAYLERYPQGEFAPLARLALEKQTAPTIPARPPQALIELLPAESFTASTTWWNDYSGHGPANAKYNSTATHSNWSAGTNDSNQWLQVDLRRVNDISAIGTKGRFNDCLLFCGQQWVTAYHLSYSVDGATWQFVTESGRLALFAGNTDHLSEVRHRLPTLIKARWLRFHPQRWYGHITMRVEAYGVPVEE